MKYEAFYIKNEPGRIGGRKHTTISENFNEKIEAAKWLTQQKNLYIKDLITDIDLMKKLYTNKKTQCRVTKRDNYKNIHHWFIIEEFLNEEGESIVDV